jgi:ATP-dependent protease ClpP protease subunit
MAKSIKITGQIGEFGFSKTLMGYLLKEAKGEPVEIEISSLGGSLDHALDIHKQLVDYKNVSVMLTGFVASAATIIAMGAKEISMSENAFFLIHKPMTWVDVWGAMNEDEIEDVIKQLEQDKENNKKFTGVLARMYVDYTGKPMTEIMNLMKKNEWLTAEEAKTWGFVSEIKKVSAKVNLWEDLKLVAMIEGAGYPVPTRNLNTNKQMSETKTGEANTSQLDQIKDQVNSIWNKLFPPKEEKAEPKNDAPAEPTLEDQVKALTDENKALKDTLSAKDASVEALKSDMQALKSQIEALSNSAAADTDLNKETDATKTASPINDFREANQMARDAMEFLNR